ncbi:MAG TPA: SMP-30/gluconolactonase/LRE family protein [Terriglobales bacterium]|nr:SMP-30/gluconolactonase/LRE family protein [Terriglobales bacterium]
MDAPLVTGRYFEAPRWHDGALWLVDSLARTLLRVRDGKAVIVCALPDVPAGLGFLPDGTPIVTAMFTRRLLRCTDGEATVHADLADVARGTIDDMIVDAAGVCYVGDLGFDLMRGVPPDARGGLVRVTRDGRAERVADDLWFPNGIAVADGRIVVAETNGDSLAELVIGADAAVTLGRRLGPIGEPDGVCLDSAGGAWVAAFKEDAIVRIDPDGRETERIAVPGRGIACVLGGGDRRTLFCVSAETSHEDLRRGRSTSRIDTVRVAVPGAGAP